MAISRKPPLPLHFNKPTPGICRWCNGTITKKLKNGKPSKSTWHEPCVAQYKTIHWPSYTRKLVWRRDKGKCASCGTKCDRKGTNGWHMDHRVPIFLANSELWVWELPNLQTLCKSCHKEKTTAEAGIRAHMRKSINTR